ncbi:hypothetical protein BS50DRAFT_498806 [Corynespora cassiicola Philippines]|uniref:Kinetochore protein mis14 n=1 Tax=Corynespora cassiicola Philippines TaxID=1448308 RepID=A0A2T2NFK7_CORCC|nr:hypothetical protein BS50DRAFT_498806 [Corynespora cassiicola Philippines]
MEEHRKIELQSPADLAFITSQIRTAARAKLDLHLPPVSSDNAGEPDELRRHAEDLVDAFVSQVLAGMRENISINGIDVVSHGNDHGQRVEVEEFEPFDEKVRARLGAAVQRRDALVGKISAHRRTTPTVAAKRFEEQLGSVLDAEKKAQEEASRGATILRGEHVADVKAADRLDEVERNWERAVEGLGRLKGGLPETRARLERCGGVVGYLEGKGK